MSRMMTLATVLAVALGSSACATRTVYVCPELPEPTRPSVPRLMDGALQCVSDIDAQQLAERERRLIEYAEDLEVIIGTHNENCQEYRGHE